MKSSKTSFLKRTSDLRMAIVCLLPALIIFGVFTFYPLFRAIYLSFFLTGLDGKASLFVGLENYAYMFTNADFWKSMKVTFLFVLYTVPASMAIGLFLGVIANEELRGKRLFRVLFSTTKVISGGISAILWLFLFNPSLGFINYVINLFGIPGVNWLTNSQYSFNFIIHNNHLD